MFFLNTGIPFVRFLVVLMAGIATGIQTGFMSNPLLLLACIAVYIVCVASEKKIRLPPWIKSSVAWVILFLCGVLLVSVRTEKNTRQHFIHQRDSIQYYKAVVIGQPEETSKTIKLVFEVLKIRSSHASWQKSCGKLIGYISKNNLRPIRKGDIFLIRGIPATLLPPANPGQFDYSAYLNRQNIYATHFLQDWQQIGHHEDHWWIQAADRFRSFCETKLREGIKNDNEYFLTVALLLGGKAGLDEKLYQAYSDTGTVHALAVSGLHVSLIYFIVIFLFGVLKKIKYGKFLFAMLSITVFWFYALITGFSPSVVRAVTMFSVFLLAGILKRNSGIYNTLAFSAFIILCVEPFWMMDIGFQFSFLAVVGIAYLYPIMYSWWTVKIFLLDKLWSLICVSMAAQLAVAPLSVYYFHSFPLLFLPFNMLIVPLSSLALYTGLVGLMACKIDFLFKLCMIVTEYIVRFMNDLVRLPEGGEFLKIDFLYLSTVELILLYLVIILLFFGFKNKHYKSFAYATCSLIAFSIMIVFNSEVQFRKNVFTVYQVKNRTVVSLIHRGHALVLSDLVMHKKEKDFGFNLYNHLAEKRTRSLEFVSFRDTSWWFKKEYPFGELIVWRGIKILRIDRSPISSFPEAWWRKLDYVIVSDRQYYKMLKQIPTVDVKILIDPSVKEKMNLCNPDFYYINNQGAYSECIGEEWN
ncbi:MAG TPA: ComEC/Rec2 family competence protein [Cytophagaceae bacterium]|nr:ComEC/Rec2 family competence protein [Cytophagaceae bacterium]